MSGLSNKKGINIALTYGMLIIYGCITAYIIVKSSTLAYRWMPIEDFYMSLRIEWLDMFINEVKTTGVYTGLHRLYDQNSAIYMYLSYFGRLVGFDAVHTFFYIQLIMVYMCVALYPIVFYRLTNRVPLALRSVLMFVFYKPYSLFLQNDSHFIYSWMTFISLPILYFLYKEEWKKSNWFWIAVLTMVGAVCNVFRGSSGLALMINTVVLLVLKHIFPYLKNKDYRKILTGLLRIIIVVSSQKLFTGTLPNMYQAVTDQPERMPLKGPWHTLYVGLGWEENPMGIVWLDECGYAGREHLLYDVSEGYYVCKESPRYSSAIKDAYFETVFNNFSFVFGSYVRKCFKALNTVLEYSLVNPEMWKSTLMYRTRITYIISFITPIIALIYLFRKYKEKAKTTITGIIISLFVSIVSFAFGMIPGIIAYPGIREYLYGAISVLDFAVMITFFVCIKAMYEIYEEKHIIK